MKRDILNSALEIQSLRPKADMQIEQYLMTPESMTQQVIELEALFTGKTILHLGDDDHLSGLFAKYLNCKPIVTEYDPRVRASLRDLYNAWNVTAEIHEYDARNSFPPDITADAFYINPPYSSKNSGKGAKVWLNRVSGAVAVGSTSVLVYPIDETLPWTLECTHEIIDYAYKCGLAVTKIVRDLHTYEHLPKDPGLLSSNIHLYKYADLAAPEITGIEGDALYR